MAIICFIIDFREVYAVRYVRAEMLAKMNPDNTYKRLNANLLLLLSIAVQRILPCVKPSERVATAQKGVEAEFFERTKIERFWFFCTIVALFLLLLVWKPLL